MRKVSVGFSRTDITPLESVPLAGYGNTARRMSGPVLSPLLATCMAFSDGENTRFCPGSGEELAGHYINLLTKLKEDSQ